LALSYNQSEQSDASTFDADDLQIAVSAGDSKLSSYKQSPSPWGVPCSDFDPFTLANRVENMLFGLSKAVGDVGMRAIIVTDLNDTNFACFSEQRTLFPGDRRGRLTHVCTQNLSFCC